MVPDVGIELTTYRLQGGCSIAELIRQVVGGSHEAGWGPQLNTLKEKPHGANPFPPTRLGTVAGSYCACPNTWQSPCVLATRHVGDPVNPQTKGYSCD